MPSDDTQHLGNVSVRSEPPAEAGASPVRQGFDKTVRYQLSIVVLTYNGEDLLDDCLESIRQQTIPCDYEVVVVDNGSTVPAKPPKWVRLVRYADNAGNIEGTNRCIRAAQGEWILFVANDVRLQPGCVRDLWLAVKTLWDNIGLVQPILMQPDGQVDNAGLRWVWPGYGLRLRKTQYYFAWEVPVVANTCWMAKTAGLAGGFDKDLGISHEDVDLCLALSRFKRRHFVVNTKATHLMGQTIGRVVRKPLSPYYHQARLRVLEKHYSGAAYWARRVAVEILDWLSRRRPGR